MPTSTQEQSQARAKGLFHHVTCEHLKGLNIKLAEDSGTLKKHLAILGMSSKETIGAALNAVDASPFKTIFVVREATGEVLFALSKNEEYVEAAKKKKPKPGPPPAPPPTTSVCCDNCYRQGGYACDQYADGSCICYGAGGGGGGGGNIDDELETLAF